LFGPFAILCEKRAKIFLTLRIIKTPLSSKIQIIYSILQH